MTLLGYIEERSLNHTETPEDLLADIGRALTHGHSEAVMDYEHRYIDIHYPTRQCPACGGIERLQVVLNTDVGVRTRCCPSCDVVVEDEHLQSEQLLLALRTRRRLRG